MKYSGMVHAALATWDLFTTRRTDDVSVTGGVAEDVAGESVSDKQRFAKDRRDPTVVSTDPKSYDQFERDNSWGQAIQLLENYDGTPIVRFDILLMPPVENRSISLRIFAEDMAVLCVAQFVQAGDWVQVTVQFTKLSMHVSIEPASAVGRRRRAQQQHAQPEPQEVWEEVDGSATTARNWSATNQSEAWERKSSGWVWLDA